MEHLITLATNFVIANSNYLDILFALIGFGAGLATKFKTPIILTILLLRILKHYLETHPYGKKVSKDTNIDERVDKLLATHNPKNKVIDDGTG